MMLGWIRGSTWTISMCAAVACGPQVALDDGGDDASTSGPDGSTDDPPPTTLSGPADSSGGVLDTGLDDSTGAPPTTWCIDSVPAPASAWPEFFDNDFDGQPEYWAPVYAGDDTELVRQVMNPDRTFTPISTTPIPGSALRFGDVDGDGRADGLFGPMPYQLFLADNAGDIGMLPPLLAALEDDGYVYLLDDVTGDGIGDAVTRSSGVPDGIRVQVGIGNGDFVLSGAVDLVDVTVVDPLEVYFVDEPRTLVLIYGEWCDFCVPQVYVTSYAVSGAGSLALLRSTSTPSTYRWLGARDRDGDGEVDVLVHDTEAQAVLWLDAARDGFTETVAVSEITLRSAFDFDLDGDLDLLTNEGVWWSDAAGTFGPPQTVIGEADARPGSADLDGDGWLDIGGYEPGTEVIWTLRPCP